MTSSTILNHRHSAKKWASKPKGIRRHRKAKRMTLTDAVRRIFYYQKKFSGRFAVFSISRDLSICKTDGARFDSFRRCYPDNLIGIYDRHLKIGDLVEDLQEYFSDEVQA